ncbi:MAG: purine-binding chemotaxis protein CheW [Lachnospiraceae bacterium]|jgi:purine-binding chemotaxis protein CheW|nr:purine-binding chemotaxis protein CheW [Lachnospiraceae bacterium]
MDDIKDIQNVEVASEGKQYIVVRLGSEQYGIDIQYIDNIVRMSKITRIPGSQKFFKGIINLRGEIIPVMSLRLKFNLEPDEYMNSTRIIIIKLEAQSAIGIIVDEVKEVVTLDENSIEKTSAASSNDIDIQYLSGVGKHADGLITLLNIASVIIEKENDRA